MRGGGKGVVRILQILMGGLDKLHCDTTNIILPTSTQARNNDRPLRLR